MANRAERRAMARQRITKKEAKQYEEQQRILGMLHSIDFDALKNKADKSYADGYDQGYRDAAIPIMKTCYAALCLTMNDKFGFDQDKCYEALQDFDQKVVLCLNSDEYVEEVFTRLGLEISFSETLNRVVKTDD